MMKSGKNEQKQKKEAVYFEGLFPIHKTIYLRTILNDDDDF